MPSWSFPVDCLGAFSLDPCAGVPLSVRIDASAGVLLDVGDRGACGASPAAAEDTLLRGGMMGDVKSQRMSEVECGRSGSKDVLSMSRWPRRRSYDGR